MCFVEDIVVDPLRRVRGGGTILMDYLIEELRTLGPCLVSAQVWRGNDASEALFRKYGFDDKSRHFYRVMSDAVQAQ